MTSDTGLTEFRDTIVATFPALAEAEFRLLTAGWHSTAVDVDDRLIFKFPRHAVARQALVREASLLAVIRPAISMPVPELVLHAGPPPFSRHEKLKGDHLVTEQYHRLAEEARRALARRMALFYAELHKLDQGDMKDAGAEPIEAWLQPAEILEKAVPALPAALRGLAERTISAWHDLSPDPHGTTYGFFDGHGWNMAFDHGSGTLSGIYDFADSGFGALHQEFIYSNFIAPDLTRRIVDDYETLSGRALDRLRIDLLTGVHRLSELAALADDPLHAPAMIRHVADWAASRGASVA